MKEPVSLVARTLSLIAATVLLGSALAAAQAPPQPQLFGLHRESVRPSLTASYEATTKEFLKFLQQAPGKLGQQGFTTFMADDFNYYMVTPLGSFADLGAVYAGFAETAQKVGPEKYWDLMHRNGAAVETMADSVLVEDPSLSYTPAKPRLKREEIQFVHFEIFYVMPGHDVEAEQVARDFRALFEKKGIANGYRLFTVATGADMPALVISIDAKDKADYVTSDAADRKALGKEGEALFARAFSHTRRYQTVDTVVRPDLSLLPVR